jgi:phthalate 4,5-dioxygenase reductase subunit
MLIFALVDGGATITAPSPWTKPSTEPSMTETPAPSLVLRLTQRETIAADIHRFELRLPDGGELPPFTAGAHIAVQTPNGTMRKYSLCNDPLERERYVIAIKREMPGTGGSASLIDAAKPGDAFSVTPPVNDFALPGNARTFIFIAGGIGITPIMAMIREIGSEGGKTFKLYYCTRSPEATAFREELSGPEFKGKVVIHHDGGDPQRMLDLWPVLEERKNLAHVYCCGPRALMESVRDMSGHWPQSAVHFESFVEGKVAKPDDKPFTVKLARSGEVIEVPVGVTILDALRAAGHAAPSSCESGTCGTCRTALLEGEADHRDLVLGEHERSNTIMICVSRAKSPQLVIDR